MSCHLVALVRRAKRSQQRSRRFTIASTGNASLILILWRRLKSVAGAEFARLNIGVRITRENSENGVRLTRESSVGREQKSRNGKGVRRGGERLSN